LEIYLSTIAQITKISVLIQVRKEDQMPLSEKFPIGSRVSGRIVLVGEMDRPYDIPMRVLGYDGLKSVIVETLEDAGTWRKGKVALIPTRDLSLREEVKFIPGEAQDGDGAAIGWMELGGLSVALTRDRNGVLLIAIEKAPDVTEDLLPIPVRISKQDGENPDLWAGQVP
jgi:hypothetical protein